MSKGRELSDYLDEKEEGAVRFPLLFLAVDLLR